MFEAKDEKNMEGTGTSGLTSKPDDLHGSSLQNNDAANACKTGRSLDLSRLVVCTSQVIYILVSQIGSILLMFFDMLSYIASYNQYYPFRIPLWKSRLHHVRAL